MILARNLQAVTIVVALCTASAFLDPNTFSLKTNGLRLKGGNATKERHCIEHHVVNASDGTPLTTIVVIPYPCDEKYPAVIDRSPYGPTLDMIDLFYVPVGFTAIIQNQRGCFTSGGDYDFWKMDGSDAYDTMKWFVESHPTSNGDIYTSGISADGISAIADWTVNNTFIKGSSTIWATGYAHEAAYWGGAYRIDLISHWLLSLNLCPNAVNIEQQVREEEGYTEWWAPIEASGPYGDNIAHVNAPGLSQAGWWDIFLQGQIDTFDNTVRYAQESVRDKQWLWVIPGGHCTGNELTFGYPKFESLQSFPLMAEQIFKGDYDHRIFQVTGHYNVYVMGPVPLYSTPKQRKSNVGNYWTSFNEWPAATPQKWYLGPQGVATANASETQSWEGGDDYEHTFTHDPNADPVPAVGAVSCELSFLFLPILFVFPFFSFARQPPHPLRMDLGTSTVPIRWRQPPYTRVRAHAYARAITSIQFLTFLRASPCTARFVWHRTHFSLRRRAGRGTWALPQPRDSTDQTSWRAPTCSPGRPRNPSQRRPPWSAELARHWWYVRLLWTRISTSR